MASFDIECSEEAVIGSVCYIQRKNFSTTSVLLGNVYFHKHLILPPIVSHTSISVPPPIGVYEKTGIFQKRSIGIVK